PLYGGHGMVLSWVNVGDTGSADMNGQLTWIRPTLPTAKIYPEGFAYQADLAASRFVRPSPGGQVLALTDANVSLSGGGLSDNLAAPISIGPNSRVKNLVGDHLNMSFSGGNGIFKGSVLPPGSRRSVGFSGVVFQKQNAAYGYFLGQGDSGTVTVG